MSESNDGDERTDSAGGETQSSGPFLPVVVARARQGEADDFEPAAAGAKPDAPPLWRRYAPLAAGIALAAAVGALAGAGATARLLRDSAAPATAATSALQDSVTRLESELATLKAGLTAAQRSASGNFGKLAERLDRTEKAQAEPAAKLAKLTESVDKLDRRLAQAGAHAAPEVTGSVTAAKQDLKPPLAEGWRLRDFYAGRAVVESRSGRLFEIGPGSNLPGLGRVETIKRQDGHVVVVTRNGIISASLEPRRPPYYLPYRY